MKVAARRGRIYEIAVIAPEKDAETPSAPARTSAAAAAVTVSRRLFLGKSTQQSHQLRLFIRLLNNIERLWLLRKLVCLNEIRDHP